MISIDEAIANERKTAEHYHKMYEFECSRYGKRTVDSGVKLECVQKYEYHSQLVEFLEELKKRQEEDYRYKVLKVEMSQEDLLELKERMKNLPLTIVSTPEVESSIEFVDDVIRNKAIDDFKEKLVSAFNETNIKEYGFYPENLVNQVAEQLKEV